jgi:phosphopantothenoylcysteine decarboxylase/phosphopantothenate--cysteine ligase
MEPASGYLACGYEGQGRLPDPEKIAEEIERLLKKKDLEAEKTLDYRGSNREPLDPVRYISNRSSGKMGYALAARGTAPGCGGRSDQRSNLARAAVRRACDRRDDGSRRCATPFSKNILNATAVIMAAAVADYHAAAVAERKNQAGSGSGRAAPGAKSGYFKGARSK